MAKVLYFFNKTKCFRMKGDRSPEEMNILLLNIKVCYEYSNDFDNRIWLQYVNKEEASTKSKMDTGLNKLASIKWNNQHPDARFKYKKAKNPSAKPDSVLRIHSEIQLHDHLRRFQYRDSIFNVPLHLIIKMFRTWSMDRFVLYDLYID